MQVMTTRAAGLAGIWAGWRSHTFPLADCTTSYATGGWTASRAMPRLCSCCRCKPQPHHGPDPCCSLAVCLCISVSVSDPSQCLPAASVADTCVYDIKPSTSSNHHERCSWHVACSRFFLSDSSTVKMLGKVRGAAEMVS